jgi:hypothetical protein
MLHTIPATAGMCNCVSQLNGLWLGDLLLSFHLQCPWSRLITSQISFSWFRTPGKYGVWKEHGETKFWPHFFCKHYIINIYRPDRTPTFG